MVLKANKKFLQLCYTQVEDTSWWNKLMRNPFDLQKGLDGGEKFQRSNMYLLMESLDIQT